MCVGMYTFFFRFYLSYSGRTKIMLQKKISTQTTLIQLKIKMYHNEWIDLQWRPLTNGWKKCMYSVRNEVENVKCKIVHPRRIN